MKKLLSFLALILMPALASGAQYIGNITAAGASCSTTQACVVVPLDNTPGFADASATITLSGTFVATVQYEVSADGGNTFTNIGSATAAGATTVSVASEQILQVRASAYTSGNVSVTVQTSTALSGGGAIPNPLKTVAIQDKGGQVYNVKAYGAAGNGVFLYNCSITTGTAALTCTTGAFTSADVGKLIEVDGAAASSGRLLTTISAVTDATHLTVAANAGTTTSTANVVYGTDDGPEIQALITTLSTSSGGTMFFPKGIYIINNASDVNGFILDIPFSASPTTPTVNYKFEGPTNMGMVSTTTGVNTSGAVLYDMSAAVTGFIGASSVSPSFPKSDVYIIIDKMAIITPPTQNYAALHFQLAYDADVLSSLVSPNYGPKATNNIPVFGSTANYGIRLSDQANGGTSSVQNSAVAGYYTGVLGADHAMILRSIFQNNKYGIKNIARFYGMLVSEVTIQSSTVGIVNDFGNVLWGNAAFETNGTNLGIDTGTEMGTGFLMLADSSSTPKVDTSHMNPGMFWIDGNNGNFNIQGMRTNAASNTDLAGQITLSSGTGTYTFLDTYTSAPICTASDTTAANAVHASTTTTALTLTGTATDVINYICIGRN